MSHTEIIPKALNLLLQLPEAGSKDLELAADANRNTYIVKQIIVCDYACIYTSYY